jgi:GT2 family glycosyltransferase
LRCLENLYSQGIPKNISLRVFLVDDGCTDGTGAAVQAACPAVEVIKGTGDLYWCNGMRLAWDFAAKEDPDFYLWLNDDVILFQDAVHRLLTTYAEVSRNKAEVSLSGLSYDLCSPASVDSSIVVGSTCDPETGELTYGGQHRIGRHPSKFIPVLPGDMPKECDTFEGNVVLIPRAVYQRVGNMRSFGHAMGDTDYGMRAVRSGCHVVVASGFSGTCSANRPGDLSREGFRKGWHVLMHRLPPFDYLRFLREHVGWSWPLYWLRPYSKLILSGMRRYLSFRQ